MTKPSAPPWTPEDSASLYGIRGWGAGYFDLNDRGDVTVKVQFPAGEAAVSLMEIVSGIQERGHALPVLLRVENLLDAQIVQLNEAFRSAIARAGYRGSYRGVFPVKVNQQCQVIEEITHFGARYRHGLEAGSKAELILALAALGDGGLLICNGYKDREFIDLGLWAQKLGYSCFFVIESPAELPILLERSRALGIRPLIGARVKVSARVGGLWTETSGDRSSFGLSTAQLVALVDTLKEEGMLDCLQLLHCHLGSQIPHIEDIRGGVREACRFYADLVLEGAPMGYLDLGGGLAVDYMGSRTNHVHSRDYTLEDYSNAIVEVAGEILDMQDVPHPHLVTESGRATVAYSSMLLFDILDAMRFEPIDLPSQLPPAVPEQVRRLHELHSRPDGGNLSRDYSEALRCRDTVRDLFRGGQISLRMRSLSENLFLAAARSILARLEEREDVPEDLAQLKASLADIYYGNFSVFQSLPDTWAIGQVFPVMPLHRHTERPDREAIISDLTCDCDGKLDRFIGAHGERPSLPVHPLRDGEDYLMGVFLMGAYQETLGDLHNLFGDTHVVSVRINEDGGFDVMKEISGDSIGDVLSYVEYSPDSLFEDFRNKAEAAVRRGRITVPERQAMLEEFSSNLKGYTYFER
ncbi:biosynthetic arginine decarboxylase [uncultured Desulfuromonas sp.]|uniref:biosynthetic arginine decarboxylase n=1 Tax=uncultured Desulfuromonas sp. TaxID=181013 RepID=UPI00263A3BDC|nr:biosynthetic arginine decarboxylase [uncultured Desulfuromonas sp.]